MLQPSRGKTFNQGSLNSNHVFRLLKVLLKSEWRQIIPLFKALNDCAHYTSLVLLLVFHGNFAFDGLSRGL